MSRRTLIAGNWKLNNNLAESVELAKSLVAGLSADAAADVVIAPVFTALSSVKAVLAGSKIGLSSQDVYWEAQGAFTGEVSSAMLADVGCSYGIVGHSERRQFFGETDETVARKMLALLGSAITPIVCVGETLEQRESGSSEAVVLGQLDAVLDALNAGNLGAIVLAYEPIWAIGTGRTAQPADAQQMHRAIRARIKSRFDDALGEKVRILYGGSVKPTNAVDLLGQTDIDGALVGGASLKAESFLGIIAAA